MEKLTVQYYDADGELVEELYVVGERSAVCKQAQQNLAAYGAVRAEIF